MTRRLTLLFTAVLIVPSGTVMAQMSGSSTGRYTTHTISQDMQEFEDGSAMMLMHYHQSSLADDSSHPADNTSSMCVGQFMVGADGSMSSGNGSCFSTDADGDGASFWWRMTESGTNECPDACGVWGYFAGTGKNVGIEGTGTWERTTLFPDASTGTWTGAWSLP